MTNPFPADALAINRSGGLSEGQRRNLGAVASYRRRNQLTIAAFLTAGGLIVRFLASPKAPVFQRDAIAGAAFVLAAFFFVRFVTGAGALARALEDGRVESVEGAIGKRRTSAGRNGSIHYLDVGDRTFKIGLSTYMALPDAGWAKVYYLPQSGTVINFETLPHAGTPPDLSAGGMGVLRAALKGSRRERNEARAGFAGVEATFKTAVEAMNAPPPRDAGNSQPLDTAIVGTWRNPLVHVTFSDNGALTVDMLGRKTAGRWSVDAAGRLSADIMGQQRSTDASISGDQLTIDLGDRRLTLTREGA